MLALVEFILGVRIQLVLIRVSIVMYVVSCHSQCVLLLGLQVISRNCRDIPPAFLHFG